MWAPGDLQSDPALWPTICAIWRPGHTPQYGIYWWNNGLKMYTQSIDTLLVIYL
jgi:hypothetical protein